MSKKKSFGQLIKEADTPVLVDFYADWCGPCKTMAPILKTVAKSRQGSVKVIKIDVDRNRAISEKFQIRSIPTLIMFKNGEPVWRQAGVVYKHQLEEIIDHVNAN